MNVIQGHPLVFVYAARYDILYIQYALLIHILSYRADLIEITSKVCVK